MNILHIIIKMTNSLSSTSTALRRFDLNLLVVFDVLMQERSITQSATRLNMSQPAVSHALSRLRQHLDDPLLVRAGGRMQASPRALALHEELRGSLSHIEQTLSPRPNFSPSTSKRSFTIATIDYVESLFLPPLLNRLQQHAPGITLQLHHLPYQLPQEEIESGAIEMAIGLAEETLAKRFRTRPLLEDDYLCAMSKRHPLAGRKLTLRGFAAHEHLLVAPEEKRRQMAEALFPGAEEPPKIIANIPHFLVALSALKESNCLLCGPRLLLRKFERTFDLHLAEIPLNIPPFQVSMVWHRLSEADPGLAWLRQQLKEIALDQALNAPTLAPG